MANKNETKKTVKTRKIPTGYTLSSRHFGKNKDEQTGMIRTGKYTSIGLSIKAGVIYEEGSHTYIAIHNLSDFLKKKMFRVTGYREEEIEQNGN